MQIELQIKLWDILTAYRAHLLDAPTPDGFLELERSLSSTPGFKEWEDRLRPYWSPDAYNDEPGGLSGEDLITLMELLGLDPQDLLDKEED